MKARRVKKLDPAGPLGENAARIIKVRLDELRSFAPSAFDREGERQQHDMRIAAKRLRYVLEVTGFCFGSPVDTARRRARDLQDILGEMHDCDVMLPLVHEHPDQDAGLVKLTEDLRARRERLFDRFVAFWRRQEETGTWLRLERAVEGHAASVRR